MAVLPIIDPVIVINGTDISDHCTSVDIPYSAEVIERTRFGHGFRNRVAGLKDFSVGINVQNDEAAGKVNSVLFPLVGQTVTCSIKPKTGAVSETNPAYEGNVVVEGFNPLSAEIGQISTTDVNLPGDGVLVRRTT